MKRLVFSISVAALTAMSASAQTDIAPSPSNTLGFEIGETLLYEAKFGFITLGSGMMNVAGVDTVRGEPTLHTIFVLRGGGMIYRLHDRMDSWIAIEDFSSRRFIQDFHEGGSHRRNVWDIYPDSGFYIEEGVDSTQETSLNPLDDLAFFYFVRTVDLEVGQRYEYDNYFRPDRNPVVLEVLERDTLDLPAGRFPSIVVHPIIQGRGILAEGKEARMWISDDDRRLVVQLKVKFSFATITLRLKDIVDEPPEDMLQRPTEGN